MAAFTQRLMLPDDANPAGNVHGGTILKMIEQAGYIAAMRHVKAAGSNSSSSGASASAEDEIVVVMGTIDCTFLRPMHIGDVSRCEAKVTYAINSAVEVTVTVTREDLQTPESKLVTTNKANIYYVQCKNTSTPATQASQATHTHACAIHKHALRPIVHH